MSLTETQTFVLTAAAEHPEHRIEAFPEHVKGGARTKVLAGLYARGWAWEVDDHPVLTDEGFRAIGRERLVTPAPEAVSAPDADPGAETASVADTEAKEAKPRRHREGSKQSRIIEALKTPEGITLAGLVALTGWRAHSVRGVLANLKRAGVPVTSRKEGVERVYRAA